MMLAASLFLLAVGFQEPAPELPWQLTQRIKNLGQPPIGSPPRYCLDWLCKFSVTMADFPEVKHTRSIPEYRINSDGLGMDHAFVALWLNLADAEKNQALKEGITYTQLNKKRQALFYEAVAEAIPRQYKKPDIDEFFLEPEKVTLKIETNPFWSLRTDAMAQNRQTPEAFEILKKSGAPGEPYKAVWFSIWFKSPKGQTETTAEIYKRI